MRIIVFCAIVLLVAFGASAQEGHQPPQPHRQPMPEEVELRVVISTGKEKPDVHHTEVMPKSMTRMEQIETCTTMAHEFLSHKYPDSVDAQALIATCIVPLNIKDDDS